jgi:regulator of nonsense transcripts 3
MPPAASSGKKTGGVLAINPAKVTGAKLPTESTKATKSKAAPEGHKVVIRRLPPALTEEEFNNILGDVWKVGKGKVTWFSFRPGKVSKEYEYPQDIVILATG